MLPKVTTFNYSTLTEESDRRVLIEYEETPKDPDIYDIQVPELEKHHSKHNRVTSQEQQKRLMKLVYKQTKLCVKANHQLIRIEYRIVELIKEMREVYEGQKKLAHFLNEVK